MRSNKHKNLNDWWMKWQNVLSMKNMTFSSCTYQVTERECVNSIMVCPCIPNVVVSVSVSWLKPENSLGFFLCVIFKHILVIGILKVYCAISLMCPLEPYCKYNNFPSSIVTISDVQGVPWCHETPVILMPKMLQPKFNWMVQSVLQSVQFCAAKYIPTVFAVFWVGLPDWKYRIIMK